MTRSLRRRLALLALALPALAIAAIVLLGDEDRYEIKVPMENAAGLKSGSPVVIGGVVSGQVDLEVDERMDKVIATLKIDPDKAPVGKDASVAVIAQNLLGQKQMQLTPGNLADPAPSGYVLPEDRLAVGTDLDRVLTVLDAPTRARLAVFINEAGAALTGRREDFSRFLRDAAPAFGDAATLLNRLVTDNRVLGRLLERSDRLVEVVAERRDDLTRLVDRFGEAAATISARRAALRDTLAAAPGALDQARRFLAELRQTTAPLRAAARSLTRTAPPLREALDRLEPFNAAAIPALRRARDLAPDLTRLADELTPVIRRAVPVTAQLADVAGDELPRVSRTLDRSFNNILAVIENWARAIQFRDGMSHIFRGEASVAPDMIDNVIRRLVPESELAPERRRRSAERRDVEEEPRAREGDRPARADEEPAADGEPRTAPRSPHEELGERISGLTRGIEELVTGSVNRDAKPGLEGLLQYLLGS